MSRDPEKRKIREKCWREKHKKEIDAYQAAYRSLHRKNINRKQNAYRVEHREKINKYKRLYKANHPEQRENPETNRMRSHLYSKSHHAARVVLFQRRSARKRGLPATLTLLQWIAIKIAYEFKCCYCGIKSKKLTQDHVLPLSRGGGTTPDNIVPSCQTCNSRKGVRPPFKIPAKRLLL